MRNRFLGMILLIVLLAAALVSPAHAASKTAGYWLDAAGNTSDGLHAYMSTTIGGGTAFTLYNKTGLPAQKFYTGQMKPVNSCLEADISHTLNTSTGVTSHLLEVTDRCSSHYYSADIKNNATWRSKYAQVLSFNDTGTAFNDEVVEIRIVRVSVSPEQWGAYLYNKTTAAYDQVLLATGSLPSDGWLTFEDIGATQDAPGAYCPNFNYAHTFQIRGIQQRYGAGTWVNITSSSFYYFADSMYCLPTIWIRYNDPSNPQKLRWSDNYITW